MCRLRKILFAAICFSLMSGFAVAYDDFISTEGEVEWSFGTDSERHVTVYAEEGSDYVFVGNRPDSGDPKVFKVDETGNSVQNYTLPSDNNQVGSIYVSDGAVYVGGTDGFYKYDEDTGDQQWSYGSEWVTGIAMNNDDQIFIGHFGNKVEKLDTSGNQIWEYNTPDSVNDLAIDSSGDVYAAIRDGVLHKVEDQGSDSNKAWEFVEEGENHLWAVDVDDEGNSYAAFDSTSIGVVKIDSSGSSELWKETFEASHARIVVWHNSVVYFGMDSDMYALSDDAVDEKWVFGDHTDYLDGIYVDGSGDVYTAGRDSETYKLTFPNPPEFDYMNVIPEPFELNKDHDIEFSVSDGANEGIDSVEYEVVYDGEDVVASQTNNYDSVDVEDSFNDSFNPDEPGEYEVTVTAFNVDDDSKSESTTYTVENDPLVIDNIDFEPDNPEVGDWVDVSAVVFDDQDRHDPENITVTVDVELGNGTQVESDIELTHDSDDQFSEDFVFKVEESEVDYIIEVEAVDDDSDVNTDSTSFFVGNNRPVIENLEVEPDDVEVGDELNITVEAFDPDGEVDSVDLDPEVTVEDENSTEIVSSTLLSHVSGDEFEAVNLFEVTESLHGTEVTMKFEAEDNHEVGTEEFTVELDEDTSTGGGAIGGGGGAGGSTGDDETDDSDTERPSFVSRLVSAVTSPLSVFAIGDDPEDDESVDEDSQGLSERVLVLIPFIGSGDEDTEVEAGESQDRASDDAESGVTGVVDLSFDVGVPGTGVVDSVRDSVPFIGGDGGTPDEDPEEDEEESRGVGDRVSDMATGIVDGIRGAVPV